MSSNSIFRGQRGSSKGVRQATPEISHIKKEPIEMARQTTLLGVQTACRPSQIDRQRHSLAQSPEEEWRVGVWFWASVLIFDLKYYFFFFGSVESNCSNDDDGFRGAAVFELELDDTQKRAWGLATNALSGSLARCRSIE
jgi:hypothetical protein